MGWGFQRRNAPSILGFPECLQSHKRSPLPIVFDLSDPSLSNPVSARGTAGDC